MKRAKVAGLLEGLSMKELQNLITTKKKLDGLLSKKKALEKQLESVSRQIDSISTPRRKKRPARVKKVAKKAVRKPVKRPAKMKKRKRIVQPSVSSLVVEILKQKKKPMKINDIHDALLKEKKYKTQAKNFKANVRILLYKNERGLFRKVGPGKFGLAAGKKK